MMVLDPYIYALLSLIGSTSCLIVMSPSFYYQFMNIFFIISIPNDSLKFVRSQKTGRNYQPFMTRLGFALTSLSKTHLIDRPKRGNYYPNQIKH